MATHGKKINAKDKGATASMKKQVERNITRSVKIKPKKSKKM